MALDAYSPCPCGSGKKFKWCCQPIHADLEHVLRQDAGGQHEAALRAMDELVVKHSSNPEVYGRKAQLLYQNNRLEEAEKALDQAFAINPNYPFGFLLRGLFRQEEGEFAGALLLFRMAAEHYDPAAKDILAQVYSLIAECELKMNRPVAARAALKIALRCRPSEELSQGYDNLFGDNSGYPRVARKDYPFLSPHPNSPPARLAHWERALRGAGSGKLVDVQRAFEQLTRENPEDLAAWYNLGLARAWLGDNRGAIEALDNYLQREPDETRAAAAWALAEVLRLGHGMEEESDYLEHSLLYQLRDPQKFFAVMQEFERERRLTGVQVRQQEGLVTGILLEKVEALTAESAAARSPRLAAYFIVAGNLVRLWHTNWEALQKIGQELQQRTAGALADRQQRRGPAVFTDVLAEALVFPVGISSEEEAHRRVREGVQKYFEETWIHRPLRSLAGVAPLDAAGHSVLRKKLLGVIQFLQELMRSNDAYDFDRLRRRLGLLAGPAPAAQAASQPEISAMGAAELAALSIEGLSDEQLEQAYRAAQQLDAQELAVRFARAVVARPVNQERTDRYPWYSFLIQRALAEQQLDEALELIDEGLKTDCEHNQGQRRNDYELRRGQVLTRQGEIAAAREVFDRLLQRAPSNLKYRSTAVEALLSARQGAAALQYAEEGLLKAREQNDRDSEEHFSELVAAARKQGG